MILIILTNSALPGYKSLPNEYYADTYHVDKLPPVKKIGNTYLPDEVPLFTVQDI